MFTLLFPLLTLFAGIIKAEDVADFSKPVQVEFILGYQYTGRPGTWFWEDVTKYEPPNPNYDESKGFRIASHGLKASMLFRRPNDKDSPRRFEWSPDDGAVTRKTCDVWLEKEPKSDEDVKYLTYDLIGDTFGPTLEDTQFLKVRCKSVPSDNALTTTTHQTSSTFTPSDSGPTPATPPPAPKMKENLLITFMTERDNLIDESGEWWDDTTVYEDIHDDSFEVLDDADKKLLKDGNTDKQFGLGQMKYKGLSDVKRTWHWKPKPEDDQEAVFKNCSLILNKDIDPGVPEMWIWAANLDVELRRDGKRIEKAEEDKFRKDGIIELKCE